MKKPLLLCFILLLNIALYGQSVEKYLKNAIEKQNSGDNESAVAECNKALLIEPNNAIICNVRALSKYNLGLYEDAIDDYTRTIRAYPTNAIAFNYRGASRAKTGQFKEAINDFNSAIRLYSKYVSAFNNRGNAKVKLEMYNEAIVDFTEAITANPQNGGAYNNRAYAENKLRKYAEAIADCNKAMALDPKLTAAAYRNRGNAKIGMGLYEEGIIDCNQAISLDLQNAKSYNYRGYAYFRLAKFDLAIKDDNAFIEFKQEDEMAPFWEFRDEAEKRLAASTANKTIIASVTPAKTPDVVVAPPVNVAPANAVPSSIPTQTIAAANTTTAPSTANAAVQKAIAPVEAASFSINLDWASPVEDFSKLPDSTLTLVDNNEVNVKIKALSNMALDKSKFHLMVNGQDFTNGNKMTVADIEEMKQKSKFNKYTYTANVKVGFGKSTIKLMYDNVSSDELKVVYNPSDITLHVLAIGTKAQGLKYPEKDANDFAQIFTSQQGEHRLFKTVSSQLLVGDDAKAVTMAEKITEWAGKKYNDRDVLMLFISSHGLNDEGKLLITGSDYKPASKKFTTIDFKEQILDPLEGINCKKFVFIDACNSGAGVATGGGKATQIDVANEISKLVNSNNSITIISSSSSTEQSWEDDVWGNGAFTKAIKEGLTDMKADKDENGLVNMSELYDYVRTRVAELVKDAGKKDFSGNAVTQTPKMFNSRGPVSIFLKP